MKSATPSTYATVGQSISYSYLVSNSGNVRLAGPVTVDRRQGDGQLPGPEHVATSTLPRSGRVDHLHRDVHDHAGRPEQRLGHEHRHGERGRDRLEPGQETVTAVQQKTLSLDKSASPATYDSVGDVIAYSYLVTNTGNVRLAGPVTVADDKATDESART